MTITNEPSQSDREPYVRHSNNVEHRDPIRLCRSQGCGTAQVAGRQRASSHGSALSRRRMLSSAAAMLATQPFVAATPVNDRPIRSVIYIFLSGGLAQQDSFDPKPLASAEVRGEFAPIATRTPGLQICEHLPRLAECSPLWSVARSVTHPYNEHSQGHMVMLSGRTTLPIGFSPSTPKPTDHPSIAALMGALLSDRDGLPSSVVLPEKLIHRTGRVIPGQLAGQMGAQRDPWILAASRFNARTYGAWPEYEFHHQRGGEKTADLNFRTPGLSLPETLTAAQFEERLELLSQLEDRDLYLKRLQETAPFTQYRERAISMLGDGRLSELFDIHSADTDELDRYGKNTFGWSLLLARRLAEAGVGFIQVNLGNNETWDTHGNAFPHLKDYLLPPMDQSVSALLNDLHQRGMLDSTLVVMAGEFGRTPKVFRLPAHYEMPGRDHWGAVQSVLLAGCGFGGGRIIGASDSQGGQPVDSPISPEQLAATMYNALGLNRSVHWYDLQHRPMPLYHGEPIT
ncbi:MAG: DUF1501 domain-containing protein [Planctomycetaceae bacterium]|nr:DUF1501 domain-containing protein [Planctomycetaceae bacterium]